MIDFTDSCDDVEERHLQGFFVDWPDPPTPETHLQILEQSDLVVLARDNATGDIVGFVTALSDGVLCAYIPLLEVLPAHQGQGIGKSLLRRMIERLGNLYMIDVLCDPELESFYHQFAMRPAFGMMIRSYDRQSGAHP